MKTLSVKEFAASKQFVSIVPQIRVNTNGYPYLTFCTEANAEGRVTAENIYFSKTAAKEVTEGQVIDAAFLKQHQIGIVLNEAGEERIKLISNSGRVSLEELLG